MSLRLEEIRALAERVAASHGLEVVDLELQGGAKHRTLRVFIEKNPEHRAALRERARRLRDAQGIEPQAADGRDPSGIESADRDWLESLPQIENLELLSGITHADCEVFSQDFGTVLDVEELMPVTEYLLEVSSPGLDRRLTRLEQFARFQGSLVRLQLFEPVAGSKRLEGRIAGAGEGRVSLAPHVGPGQRGKRAKPASLPGEPIEVALSNIEKANLVPEF